MLIIKIVIQFHLITESRNTGGYNLDPMASLASNEAVHKMGSGMSISVSYLSKTIGNAALLLKVL